MTSLVYLEERKLTRTAWCSHCGASLPIGTRVLILTVEIGPLSASRYIMFDHFVEWLYSTEAGRKILGLNIYVKERELQSSTEHTYT